MKEIERKFFDIDKYKLDEEWEGQQGLYNEYAYVLAEARKNHGEAEAHLEYVEAEVSLDIRNNPAKYNLDKITEDVVNKATVVAKKTRQAQQAVIDAKFAMDKALADVTTLDHRKKALEDLVKLFLGDYFSRPKAPTQEHRQKMEEIERKSAYRMKRREMNDDD